MSHIRVMLVEDHTLVRIGIRAVLEQLDRITVVAEASDGRSALELIARIQPEIVLMDIAMPGMSGLEATLRVVQDYPRVRVIILSLHHSEEYVWRALQAGATGYLLKDAGTAELELAIAAAARGERYLSPSLST